MTTTSMAGRDLHLRHTDVNGASSVIQHRVWDGDLFLSTRQADAEKANRDQKDGQPRRAKVELITREQYVAQR